MLTVLQKSAAFVSNYFPNKLHLSQKNTITVYKRCVEIKLIFLAIYTENHSKFYMSQLSHGFTSRVFSPI